jgi:hypothetical protein
MIVTRARYPLLASSMTLIPLWFSVVVRSCSTAMKQSCYSISSWHVGKLSLLGRVVSNQGALRSHRRRARMDEKDQELLERQMRGCQPPPPGNVSQTLVGVVLFVSGLLLGSLLFAPTAAYVERG